MRIDVHVFLHGEQDDQVLAILKDLLHRSKKMDQDVQNLIDAVAEVKGKVASVVAFITGLEQRIKDILASENLSPETKAALASAFADLKSGSQELTDAIDNDPNTPAPPAP